MSGQDSGEILSDLFRVHFSLVSTGRFQVEEQFGERWARQGVDVMERSRVEQTLPSITFEVLHQEMPSLRSFLFLGMRGFPHLALLGPKGSVNFDRPGGWQIGSIQKILLTTPAVPARL